MRGYRNALRRNAHNCWQPTADGKSLGHRVRQRSREHRSVRRSASLTHPPSTGGAPARDDLYTAREEVGCANGREHH